MEAQISLIPKYKVCSFCNTLIDNVIFISGEAHFSCLDCGGLTHWGINTILEKSRISMTTIEKLLVLFLDHYTVSEAHTTLMYPFISEKINIKTVRRYFEVFGKIVYDTVQEYMYSTLLEGEIELDETYMFKEKKSSAPYRGYVNKQWLFGLKKRGSNLFVVIPVEHRDADTLIPIILKHAKVDSIIYSDSFAVYVNTRSNPRASKLIKYGYAHFFVNHKVEFVSSLIDTVHTNSVERLWGELKGYLQKMHSANEYLFYIYRYYIATFPYFGCMTLCN